MLEVTFALGTLEQFKKKERRSDRSLWLLVFYELHRYKTIMG